jgi:adenylate cyclase
MAAILKSNAGGASHPLEDFNLIGRSPDATVRISDAGISRQHATIRREGKYFWLSDLGSANGTFVNDVPVSAARALRQGDRLQFGTTQFVFNQDDSEGKTEPQNSAQTQVLRTMAVQVRTFNAILLVGDLRDFTRIASQLSAEEVAAMLREWYADCDNILKARGATIDKFIGDGVFAYWVADDNASRAKATEAARLLSDPNAALSPTRRWLKENLGIEVRCHVGLHVGEVALGAMGRGVNTAVGEAVNVTFRIEGLTRKLETPVLATADFVAGCPDRAEVFENAGVHTLKGQPEPVEVYKLKNWGAVEEA